MSYDKKTFLKEVVVLHDTREQKNDHIIHRFENMSVKHQERALKFGDYSFIAQDVDFCLSCVIERKASVDELYSNFINDRERIEKEFLAGSTLANEFTLMIETVPDIEALRDYEIPDWKMKVEHRKIQKIGELCYATIQSWQSGSKYRFRTIFVRDKEDSATKILETFYWFWRNFKELTASRRNRG